MFRFLLILAAYVFGAAIMYRLKVIQVVRDYEQGWRKRYLHMTRNGTRVYEQYQVQATPPERWTRETIPQALNSNGRKRLVISSTIFWPIAVVAWIVPRLVFPFSITTSYSRRWHQQRAKEVAMEDALIEAKAITDEAVRTGLLDAALATPDYTQAMANAMIKSRQQRRSLLPQRRSSS